MNWRHEKEESLALRFLNSEFYDYVIIPSLYVIVGVGLLIAMIVGVDIVIEYNTCQTYQSVSTEYEYEWHLWGGCLVGVEGVWQHYDDVNLVNLNDLGE